MTSTTTAWSETEHPRAAQGTFADKPQGAPEIALTAGVEAPTNSPEMAALLDSATSRWREAAAEDDETPEVLLIALSLSDNPSDRAHVASHHLLPMHVLERLVGDEGEYVKEGAARNPNLTTEMIDRFLPEPDSDWWEYDTLDSLARHANASEAFLAGLNQERFGHIRTSVAGNENAGASTVESISRDSDEWIRKSVIDNKFLSASIMERLATDESLVVKQSLAGRHHMPESIYRILAADTNPRLREYVASSYATPKAVRDELKLDADPGVMEAANRRSY